MTKEEVGKSLPKFFSCKNNTEMWKKLCSIAEEYDGTDLNYYYWMNNYVPEDTPMFRQWANVKDTIPTYDFSVYSMPQYKVDTFYCYKEITRQSVGTISKWLSEKKDIKSILDFAGGTGLSTLQLALNFPDIEVYYYDTGKQKKFLEYILNSYTQFVPNNFIILDDLDDRTFNLITVFEVIEHWQRPYDFV